MKILEPVFSNATLITWVCWAALGSTERPCRCAAVCLGVLAGQFNTGNIGEGPGIWTADVGSSR